ncbi:MAG: hypothetical protein AAF936_00475 [Pseudomonadota bacterium]
MISRALASLVGAILFLYGIVAAASPLPLGVPLMVFGFLIFAGANPAARPLLRRMRRRWKWFDALVRQVGKRSPDRFETLLNETEPEAKENGAKTAKNEASNVD